MRLIYLIPLLMLATRAVHAQFDCLEICCSYYNPFMGDACACGSQEDCDAVGGSCVSECTDKTFNKPCFGDCDEEVKGRGGLFRQN